MTDKQFAILLQRLDRIEAALTPSVQADLVLSALADLFSLNPFTSSEAWVSAQAAADAAAAIGQRLPDLPHELERAGISSAHGLGRYLAAQEGRGVNRIGQERGGIIWQLAVSRGDETADLIHRDSRSA